MSQPQLGAVVIEVPHPRPSQQGGGREPWKIALIADRRLSLAALSASLLRGPRYRFVDEARGTTEVHELLGRLHPALLVMDVNDARSFSAIDPTPWSGRLLVLLDPDAEPALVSQAVRMRPFGYLSRGVSRTVLEAAIESAATAEFYLDPLLSARILQATRVVELNAVSEQELSGRERSILVRIASGRGTKEIAREYAIAPKTVSNHVTNIYQKLHVRHRGELVLYAARQGLTTI